MAEKISTTASSSGEIDEALRRYSNGILPDDAIVRSPVVRVLCGNITDRTLYQRVKDGKFPRPFGGDARCGWRVGDLRKALKGEADGVA